MENSELITKAVGYIQRDVSDSGMTIEDVAEHAGFSTDYFNRIFLAHTGFNVMEYIRVTRLKKAARMLCGSNQDVLGIALDCGYESPEALCRAFRKQYGVSPTEYRKQHENTEPLYGEFFNDTVAARLLHEFPSFHAVDPNEAIDRMLELGAMRYGLAAIVCKNNGGAALTDGDLRDGFVWFTEWDGRFEGEIISDDWDKIAHYFRIFHGERFDMNIYTMEDDKTIVDALSGRGMTVREIDRDEIRACTTMPIIPVPPEGFAVRELRYEDWPLIEEHYRSRESWKYRLPHLKQELYQRYELGNEEHSVFCFGLFSDDSMVGLAEGRLQRANGFVVNNNIGIMPDPDFRTEEVYRYTFAYITAEALNRGALPIDGTQTPATSPESRCGAFDSSEFGYRTVNYSCRIACG
ncbi:MAG: helix-turn-helix transcriptional regulator [Ruminococcaceae bacterium]|nr:helix-turn-helix transcriptional regulator [Oscillospiraceae bacterium]